MAFILNVVLQIRVMLCDVVTLFLSSISTTRVKFIVSLAPRSHQFVMRQQVQSVAAVLAVTDASVVRWFPVSVAISSADRLAEMVFFCRLV